MHIYFETKVSGSEDYTLYVPGKDRHRVKAMTADELAAYCNENTEAWILRDTDVETLSGAQACALEVER